MHQAAGKQELEPFAQRAYKVYEAGMWEADYDEDAAGLWSGVHYALGIPRRLA